MFLDSGFKSLISWWFGEKKRKKEEEDGGKSGDFIERDKLIKLNVKKEGQISSQHYRVLGILDKSYNMWYVDFNTYKKLISIHGQVHSGRHIQRNTNYW